MTYQSKDEGTKTCIDQWNDLQYQNTIQVRNNSLIDTDLTDFPGFITPPLSNYRVVGNKKQFKGDRFRNKPMCLTTWKKWWYIVKKYRVPKALRHISLSKE